jgi:peptidyl-prolyl cis-trans isomerase D
MAASFEEVAFRLRAGEVSAPFRSPFGWHIVKLEERKREDNEEKVRARHILVKIDPSDATEERGRQRMEEFDRALKKKPFEVASKELDLPVTDTRSFPRGRYVPYVGQNSQAMYFAFEGRIGKTSGLIEDSRGFYELKLVDRKKEGYASIEEARDRLQWLVAREQAKAKAKETAEGFLRELRSSGSLEAAARKFNVPVRSAGPFTREDAVPGVGKGNEFTGTAFSLSVGQVSGAVTTDQGAYVLRVEERLPIDEALFASQRGQLGNELLSQKRNEALQDYLREVQRQARIRDYRGG